MVRESSNVYFENQPSAEFALYRFVSKEGDIRSRIAKQREPMSHLVVKFLITLFTIKSSWKCRQWIGEILMMKLRLYKHAYTRAIFNYTEFGSNFNDEWGRI